MGEQQSILVPRISTLAAPEAKARALVRWLVRQDIIEAQPTTCGRRSSRMAHAIAPGARRVVEDAGQLPFGRPINGLEIVTTRCIYTPTLDFLEEAGCPQCRREIGPTLFDSLEQWMPGHTDNFSCPLCGHEDDINGFLFLQPCGFSNLGFVFNDWPAFTQAFLEAFAERLGHGVSQVRVQL
ncbi:MAG: sugar ABC transporter ATPase [Pseudomonadota bacterium]